MPILALLLLLASAAGAQPAGPLSKRCRGIPYARYFRVSSLAALKGAIAAARPGDMVEVMPGRYRVVDFPKPGDPGERPELPDEERRAASLPSPAPTTAARKASFPGLASSGIIMDKHGAPDALITVCGSRDAVFDGTQFPGVVNAYAFRVVSCSYIRVSGFTLQNARKGLDVQDTSHSKFEGIATRRTGQEGIRLRYNSHHNNLDGCAIAATGLEWPGWGEGVYVGTSKRNSVLQGLPRDLSHYNAIRRTTFGPGVTAENVDCKEFTRGGIIAGNTFDGSAIRGVNGASSWVSMKGGAWTAYNNTGSGLGVLGAGFRVVKQWDGEGRRNRLLQNRCRNLRPGSFCVYVSPDAGPNTVGCTNTLEYDPGYAALQQDALKSAPRACNCATPCGGAAARRGRVAALRGRDGALDAADAADVAASAYAVRELEEDEEMRPLDD